MVFEIKGMKEKDRVDLVNIGESMIASLWNAAAELTQKKDLDALTRTMTFIAYHKVFLAALSSTVITEEDEKEETNIPKKEEKPETELEPKASETSEPEHKKRGPYKKKGPKLAETKNRLNDEKFLLWVKAQNIEIDVLTEETTKNLYKKWLESQNLGCRPHARTKDDPAGATCKSCAFYKGGRCFDSDYVVEDNFICDMYENRRKG